MSSILSDANEKTKAKRTPKAKSTAAPRGSTQNTVASKTAETAVKPPRTRQPKLRVPTSQEVLADLDPVWWTVE